MASVISVAALLERGDAMLRELTDADFAHEVIESRLPWVVLFSSPWCGVAVSKSIASQ